jgi:Cu-Zn family superoxide dismutase
MKTSAFALAALLIALSVALQPTASNAQEATEGHREAVDLPKQAVAVLASTSGSDTRGIIMFDQKDDHLHITGKVINLEPGKHGFHIHEYGDLTKADGTSAGGHYAPEGHEHGAPGKSSHAGDLGNITANEQGTAMIDLKAKDLKLHLILGRAVVVHAGEDDLTSQPSGAAGPRVGVGVIGIANSEG